MKDIRLISFLILGFSLFSEVLAVDETIHPLWSVEIQAEHVDVSENFVVIVSNDTLYVFDKAGNLILKKPAPLWTGITEGYLVTIEDTNSTEIVNGIWLKVLRIVWINLRDFSSKNYTIKVGDFARWLVAKGKDRIAVVDLEPMGYSKLYVLGRYGVLFSTNISVYPTKVLIEGDSIYVKGVSVIQKFLDKQGELNLKFTTCNYPKRFDAHRNLLAVLLMNGSLRLMKDTKILWTKNLEFKEGKIHECLFDTHFSPVYADVKFLGDYILVSIDNRLELYSLNGMLFQSVKLGENITNLESSNSLAVVITPNKVHFISKDGILGSYDIKAKRIAVYGLNALVADSQRVYFFTFEPFVTVTDIDESIAREVFSNETPDLQIVLGKAAAKFVNAIFTRDTMELNGIIYKSTWKKEDYCLIQPKNGRVFIVGTHRYGTKACLLYYKERKPKKPVLLRWKDLNRNSKVEVEEIETVFMENSR
ncbi:adenosylmethionine-8-amino-7-oxononanoate aminotransferase [Thermococcus sp. 101 C5]|uniref:adenosylmethionine-8-amino-7-oxononanoate aminotransferase n=1 Tax=Thermococcus sp. 101 C5 TaxID=2654197 RepID=UPI00128E1990|nr:adenosylmethionine-8-amino-7-oxononanoate aminotransferase [Thermococcus sp. 101 C5]MPW39220.1 adenosylmethionine-8-amino-7-oxononanoate aminotransferase [Thermococcus sp. 101 C5]